MRWKNRRQSSNVEDRRGQSASPGLSMGRGSPLVRLLPMLIRRGGIKGLLFIVAGLFIASQLGLDIPSLLTGGSAQRAPAGAPAQVSAEEQQLAEFTSVVLADTETTWNEIFRARGRQYEEPKLVLFSGSVRSACGFAQAAMGPFYCPGDKKVYIDLSFYNDLRQRHGAPGDFAQAYVIAHEVGHHIQTVLGISAQVHKQKQRASKAQANQLSVRQELQADCLAGVWGNHADRARSLLEQGDLEEALRAAAAIGDDRLQKQSRGYVTPESFTHGSSEQRIKWFRTGFQSGDIDSCDTFSAAQL
ncbi:MAG: zinc metallopeptidase [Gammaproteobacteria bacterium]|nr:zinc metallopeptidase [Gammaproteobacteria bacterium]NND38285.1 zinc metallopeptidase [Pseudomonadales bacterium]MBT8151296.1 zinc metallopeptidase [Gammaproteobacteria bacterium]NNL10587.1 zinc metallopeptidase [Pseudomonadales bacterium]NNM11487.1 zinc metallopeptidase [Pseudomonadales bacterium]